MSNLSDDLKRAFLFGVGLNEELKHSLQEKIIEKEKELNSELISQIKDMKNLSDEDIKILKEKIAEVEKEKNEK